MKEQPNINSRQKELLLSVLLASAPVPLQQLAKAVKVSIRTVQREMDALKSILRQYGLKIVAKAGVGVQIEGSEHEKRKLRESLSETHTAMVYSPDKRQQGLIRDLLLAKEPVKLFVFSRKYGVTEATISYDMDRMEEWFGNFGVRLVRKPGLGVYLEGTEQQIRMAASNVLHRGMTVEEWLELFNFFRRTPCGFIFSRPFERNDPQSAPGIGSRPKHPLCGKSGSGSHGLPNGNETVRPGVCESGCTSRVDSRKGQARRIY